MAGLIEDIRVFLAVAEHGSFAAAARRLGISASAATRSVADLEARLGVQLLVRTTRRVSLTMAGAGYRAEVAAIEAQLSQAGETARRQQMGMAGRLRVSAPLAFGIRFLPDMIARFRILHPEVTLTVDLSDQFVDIVAGDYDMAIRISAPPADRSTIWRKICPVPRIVAAAPSYLERRGVPRGPDDLRDHDIIDYNNLATDGWVMTETATGRSHRFRPAAWFVSNNGDLIAELAQCGEGICFLPRFMLPDALAEGRLVPLLPDWELPEIWLTAYYPPYERLPVKVERFTEFLEDMVEIERSRIS